MVIMGIDPGTATTGYGVIEKEKGEIKHQTHGVILTAKDLPAPDRLLIIYTQINRLLDLHEPDAIATEQLFFSNNVTTAMAVGRAVRGDYPGGGTEGDSLGGVSPGRGKNGDCRLWSGRKKTGAVHGDPIFKTRKDTETR